MSMHRSSSHRTVRRTPANPLVCAKILGEHIRAARLNDGRPLEEIAPLAALTVPEWERIEAGQAPNTWEQVCLITAALYLGRSWMQYLLPLWATAKPLVSPGQ